MFKKKFDEKVNEKWKFQNFDFSGPKIEILKFSLFIDFFIEIFFEHFLVSENISPIFSSELFSANNEWNNFGVFLNQSIGYQSVGKIKSLAFPIE